jgi:MGT family glycosyltransferase
MVYVTFGTVAPSVGVWPALFRAVLDGLADLAVRVLVTAGAPVDVADLGPLPPGVAVTDCVPQDAVLRHTDVMVAHGGFGTVLGGLRAGVPMVLAPLFADQFYNAERITELGAGVAVPTSYDPRVIPPDLPDAVGAAVRRALDDPAPRTASQRLAEAMASHPPVASLVPTLKAIAGGGA